MTLHRARRAPAGRGDSLDDWLTVCGQPVWAVPFVVDAADRVTCPGCRTAPEEATIPPAHSDESAGASSHESVEPEVDYSGCPAIGVLGMHCEHFATGDGCCWCGA